MGRNEMMPLPEVDVKLKPEFTLLVAGGAEDLARAADAE
jgi:hypothetical protein